MTVPFNSILCGVEGDASSSAAVEQALALAAKGGAVHFLAVYTTFELGPDYTKEKLQESLDEADRLAGQAGVSATTEMTDGRYAVDVLLPEGRNHDLLVIGTHDHSRAAGLVLGSTASEAAHQTEGSLLIARRPPSGEFPGRVLFASDGSDDSWAPSRTAAALAGHLDLDLEMLHVDDGKHPEAPAVIEKQVTEMETEMGRRPDVTQRDGHATDKIVEAAKEGGASLVVCGRRGLTGIKSLGSVSERVAHQAECSVLLVPGD